VQPCCTRRPAFKFYVHDHLYSPVALINYNCQPLERYEYDAYGNCHVLEPNFAPDPDGISNYGNPYLCTASSLDILDNGSLKLQYNRNRYYDQYTGRWFTNDPLGITPNAQWPNRFDAATQYHDGLNLYEAVRSRLQSKRDPYGLMRWSPLPGTGVVCDTRDSGSPASCSHYDLASVCDRYTCEQCCKNSIRYTDRDKASCKREAQRFSIEYKAEIERYWRIGRRYTKCYDYVNYILGVDIAFPSYFAMRLSWGYFVLATGVRIGSWNNKNFVRVIHVCAGRRRVTRCEVVHWLPDDKPSDATLYSWAIGIPCLGGLSTNRNFGNSCVQGGWKSDVGWNNAVWRP